MACYGGGYSEDRFQTPVDNNFFCPICTDVLKDPVQCHNQHLFCRACITIGSPDMCVDFILVSESEIALNTRAWKLSWSRDARVGIVITMNHQRGLCKNKSIMFVMLLCRSVYSHRASLKNMPGHGGNRTYDLSNTSPMLCQLSYAVRSVRICDISELSLAEDWASTPKVVGSIPTVARHIFQACPVWIYTQPRNITSIIFT